MVSSWLKVLHYGRGKLGPKEQPSFDEDTVCCVVHGYETVPFPRQTVSDLHALLEINKKVKQKFRNKTIKISTPFHKYQPVQVTAQRGQESCTRSCTWHWLLADIPRGAALLQPQVAVPQLRLRHPLCFNTLFPLENDSGFQRNLQKICSSCELQSFAFCFDCSSFY